MFILYCKVDISMEVLFILETPRSLRDEGGCHPCGCWEWPFYTMRFADSYGQRGCGMNRPCNLSRLSLRKQKAIAIVWLVVLVEIWGGSYLYSIVLCTINSNISSRFKGAFTSAVFFFFLFYVLHRFAQPVYENCLNQLLSKGQQLHGSSRGALTPRHTVKSKWNSKMRLLHTQLPPSISTFFVQ